MEKAGRVEGAERSVGGGGDVVEELGVVCGVWCVVWWVKAKGEEEKKRGGGKVAEWREDGRDGMGCFRCDQRDQEPRKSAGGRYGRAR